MVAMTGSPRASRFASSMILSVTNAAILRRLKFVSSSDDDLRCGNGGLAAQNERRWRRGSGGVVLSYLNNWDGKLRGTQWVQEVIGDSRSEIVDLENLEERLAPKFRAVRDEERLFGD